MIINPLSNLIKISTRMRSIWFHHQMATSHITRPHRGQIRITLNVLTKIIDAMFWKREKKKKKVSSLIWGKQQTNRLTGGSKKKNTYQGEVRFLLVRLTRRRFLDRGPSVSCSVFFVCIVSDFVF